MTTPLQKSSFTRGGQIVFHKLRMFFQINRAIAKWGFLAGLLTTLVLAYWLIPGDDWHNYFILQWANFLSGFGVEQHYAINVYGQSVSLSARALNEMPFLQTMVVTVNHKLLVALFFGGMMWLFVIVTAILFFIRKGSSQSRSQFIRGAQLVSVKKLKKLLQKRQEASDLTIDSLPLVNHAEVQHFLVHGTVGQGKSQWIMKLMDNLRRRGDRVIVYDKGCSFIPAFYQESDVILNAFDKRCATWDLWAEAPSDAQLENMAESLIPMHGETDPFWVNAARTVFAACASKMRHDPERSLEKLLDLLVTGEFENLEPYLKGTPAGTLVSGKIEKTAISIRSVLTTYLKSLQSLRGLSECGQGSFSIRDYITDADQKGWLFISSNGDQHKSLKPLISMWIAMASLSLLSLEPDPNRRIWFICDELPSLHKLPLLGETIAEVRKFGGCFVLGMQSYAQLAKVYGRNGAGEIFDLLNTRVFFRSPSSEMARLVAHELGDEDVEESRENFSYGANSIRDGVSMARNRLSRPIISFSEIMELDAMQCFLKLPGNYPVTKMELTYQKRASLFVGFRKRVISQDSEDISNVAVTAKYVKESDCLVELNEAQPMQEEQSLFD